MSAACQRVRDRQPRWPMARRSPDSHHLDRHSLFPPVRARLVRLDHLAKRTHTQLSTHAIFRDRGHSGRQSARRTD